MNDHRAYATVDDDQECRIDGVVIASQGDRLTVSVKESDRCGGCGISFMCGGKDSRDVFTINAIEGEFTEGDNVVISATNGLRRASLALSAGLPFAIFFAALLCALALGLTQAISGGAALACVAVYFFLLYCLRRRLSAFQKWKVVKTSASEK